MKKTITSIFSLAICLALLFAACGSAGSAPDESGGAMISGGNSIPGQPTAGMAGKYVQQDVTPEGLAAENVSIGLRGLPDGRMLALVATHGEKPKALASADGAAWEEVYPIGESPLVEENPDSALRYVVDDEGAWWVVVTGEAGNKLYRVKDGTQEEIPFTVAGKVTRLQYGGDSTILITSVANDSAQWYVVDCAARSVSAPFSPASQGFTFTDYADGIVYSALYGEPTIATYEALGGQPKDSYTVPVEAELFSTMAGQIQGGNTLHYADNTGIHKAALGGTYVETLVSGQSYAFADPNFIPAQLVAAQDGSYWLAGWYGRDTPKLYRYVFDESAPLVAAESLSIWSLADSQSLRHAVSAFSQANPETDVSVHIGRSADSGAQTDDDIIRQLNTELVSGTGPDVLILDGLPIQSLIRQGMLSDLSGLVDESQYYEGILGAYKQDGKTWAYPTCFAASLMMQTPGAGGANIENIQSMEDMRPLLTDPASVAFGGYIHLFETMYTAASPQIFPKDTEVNEDALRAFLSLTKDAVDAQGIAGTEYDGTFGGITDSDEAVGGLEIITIHPSLGYFMNDTMSDADHAVATLHRYMDVMFSMYKPGTGRAVIVPLPGGVFMPKIIAAVPAGAANAEGGRAFVKAMLEGQTQEALRNVGLDGFAMRRGVDAALYLESIADFPEDSSIVLPNEEDCAYLDSVLEQLTVPASVNLALREKVYEQAKRLYSGEMGVEEAANAILQNTRLYFAEQQ